MCLPLYQLVQEHGCNLFFGEYSEVPVEYKYWYNCTIPCTPYFSTVVLGAPEFSGLFS